MPSAIRARVGKGRLLLDEPGTLPDGTVLDLVLDDEGDDLSDDERAALNDAISRAWRSARGVNCRPARDVLDELRAQ